MWQMCFGCCGVSYSASAVLFRRLDSTRTLTFSMQTLLLIQNDELAVLMGLLQDVLALLDVAVVIFQAEEGGHQCHVGLNGITKRQQHTFPVNSSQAVFAPEGRMTLKSNSKIGCNIS